MITGIPFRANGNLRSYRFNSAALTIQRDAYRCAISEHDGEETTYHHIYKGTQIIASIST